MKTFSRTKLIVEVYAAVHYMMQEARRKGNENELAKIRSREQEMLKLAQRINCPVVYNYLKAMVAE